MFIFPITLSVHDLQVCISGKKAQHLRALDMHVEDPGLIHGTPTEACNHL